MKTKINKNSSDMYLKTHPEYPELVEWINNKRMLNTSGKFIRAIKLLNIKNNTICPNIKSFDMTTTQDIRKYISVYDVGGFFIDKDDNVCLIYDTYIDDEDSQTFGGYDSAPFFFMKHFNIPLEYLSHMRLIPHRRNPPNFYTIHRTRCFIIRLPQK